MLPMTMSCSWIYVNLDAKNSHISYLAALIQWTYWLLIGRISYGEMFMSAKYVPKNMYK